MLDIDLIIKNNVNFINNFTEYENSKKTINKKLKSLKTKLFNIKYSKNILLTQLIPNFNTSKKIFKNYFPYLYNEKEKIKKKIKKYTKEKYTYKKYNINEYDNFINSIQNTIFSNTIIQNLCDIICPICLDTKITCMVKIIDNEHSIGKHNKIINMSNCKGTIICYNCCINMYNNRKKFLYEDQYSCILCNKKFDFNT